MDDKPSADLSGWLAQAVLSRQSESAILSDYCEREVARALPLAMVLALIDTLHPICEGRAFRWTRPEMATTLAEYGRTDNDLSRGLRSPFHRLEDSGAALVRRRLTTDTEAEFFIFPALRAARRGPPPGPLHARIMNPKRN